MSVVDWAQTAPANYENGSPDITLCQWLTGLKLHQLTMKMVALI